MRREAITAALRTDLAGGYDPAHFAVLAAVEENHFWFRGRNRVISSLAAQVVAGLRPGYRVLEIGCGNGNVLRHLEAACPSGFVVGMDMFREGLRLARLRTSCSLVQGDARRSPFGKAFQLIGVFDVLEHIQDDLMVLRDIYKMLDPGATLLLTVPAHPSLWSYFDEAAHHCRRYTPEELRSKLETTGYEIEYLTEYMATIYPMVWLGRRLAERRRGYASLSELVERELRVNAVLNRVLTFLLFREARWICNRWRLPFGTSLLALAIKPRT